MWFFIRADSGRDIDLLSRDLDRWGKVDGQPDLGQDESNRETRDAVVADEEHTIRGQVVRPTGEPAAGSTVLVQGAGLDEPVEVQTNTGGMFSIPDLPTRLYAVEASATGFGPATVIGVVPGGAPLRLTLSGGRSVSGVVTHNEMPVSQAVIHVGAAGMFPQRSVTSNADGTFSIGGLRPGRYEYIAISDGLSSGFGGRFFIDDDGTVSPSELRIALDSAPSTTLRIVDRKSGELVDLAVATFAVRPLHVLAIHSIADAGVAEIGFLKPDEYVLRVRSPGYLPYRGRFWIQPGGGEQVVHLSRGARVCGRTLDEAGNAVSGARIEAVIETPEEGRYKLTRGIFERFHRLARPSGAPFFWPTSNYYTSGDGSYCIGGLPSGEARIIATASEFAESSSRPLSLQSDQQYDSVNITMMAGRSIRGRVENANGEPLLGATVIATDSTLPAWISGNTQITDRSGSFRFDNLTQEIRLRARHPEHGDIEEVLSLPPNGLDGHVIRLEERSALMIQGRVLTTQSGPASGATVWLMRGGSSVPVCRAVSGADGLFRATDCSAIPERILIRYAGFAPLNAELTDARNSKDWVLRAGGEIALVTGRYPARVTVEPMFNLPAQIWPAVTRALDAWSRSFVAHVVAGRYRVTCEVEGHASASVMVDVVLDRRVEAVCPLPSQMQSFRIVVIDPQGSPIPSALVTLTGLAEPVSRISAADGSIELDAEPGRWVTAKGIHERWGEGQINLRTPTERVEPFRLELGNEIGSGDGVDIVGLLNVWGVEAVRDRRSIVLDTIEDGTPASGIGLRRQDLVLWARELPNSRLSVGIRRNGEIITFELVRQSP